MKVVIISGPTATGKTRTAIELAKQFGGEIVNFDSLLLYREINIGTAKPTNEEQLSVPHHMINVRSIAQPMNAADYSKESTPIVNQLINHNKIVYLVGGSGFYLQALLKGMYDSPTTPKDIIEHSDKLYKDQGITPFLEILKENDYQSFQRYHENDHYRIRRAVEHYWSHGTPLNEERSKKDVHNQNMTSSSIHGWDTFHIHLDMPKEEHLKIIEDRTSKMIHEGLIDEVKNLLNQGFSGLEKPLQSIGYKETLDYIFGVHKNLSEYREKIIISTRQLAKSQRTWFKRDSDKMTFHPLNDRSKISESLQNFIKISDK